MRMVKIAIAGAAGTVAHAIIDAIISGRKHSIVAITRAPNERLSSLPNTEVKIVDYADHASLVSALEGCDTVISAVFQRDDEEGALVTNQLRLLAAAHQVGVRRFAPSSFGPGHQSGKVMERQRLKMPVVEECKRIGIEYTEFHNGAFMNYFSTGSPQEQEGLAGLAPMTALVDVKGGVATIPGTGDAKLTTTEIRDVGRFVAAALDLDTWPPESGMVGETCTYNQLVSVMEKVSGRTFTKNHIPMEQLETMSKQPGRPGFIGQALLAQALGYGEVDPSLNQLCPEVYPIGLEAFLRKYWC